MGLPTVNIMIYYTDNNQNAPTHPHLSKGNVTEKCSQTGLMYYLL